MKKVDFELLGKYIMGYNASLFDIVTLLDLNRDYLIPRLNIYSLPDEVWEMTQNEAEDFCEELYVEALSKLVK